MARSGDRQSESGGRVIGNRNRRSGDRVIDNRNRMIANRPIVDSIADQPTARSSI
jgi:hypothetical protein